MFIKKTRKKKGQSTLEYIILVTGVIAVLIVFLKPSGGLFTTAFNKAIQSGTDGMENMAGRLNTSRPLSP